MVANENQESLVTSQFGPRAADYVASQVHAHGEDLHYLARIVRGLRSARILDLGCGGGHVSFRVAPEVAGVVAYDLSSDMLSAVRTESLRRGLSNVACARGSAESLPFADSTFDFVLCRYSAHHWRDVPRALREARRVLKPGNKAIFIDAVAPEWPVFDTFLQTLEMLRDPSHVRDYSADEWQRMATVAGLALRIVATHRVRLDFVSWIARMNTSDLHVRAIRSLQSCVAEEVRNYFEVAADGSFTLDVMTLELSN